MTTILAAAAVVLFAILIAICVFGYFHLSALLKDDKQKDEVKARPGKYSNIADFDIQSLHPSSCISEEPFSNKYLNTFDSFYGIHKRINDLAERVSYSQNEHYNYEKRIEKLEKLMLNDRVNDINRRIDDIYDNIEDPEDATFLFERVKKLEKLVNRLQSDKEDINKKFNTLSDLSNDTYNTLCDCYSRTLCSEDDSNSLYNRMDKLEKLVQQLYTDRDEDVNKIADQINRHEDMISDLKEDVTFMKNDYEKRFENLSELSKDYTENLQSINDRLDRIEIDKQNEEEKAEWLYENVEEGKND